MIRLIIPVLTECKPDKPEHDQEGSSNHHPMRILHRGQHRLFTPSDNFDALLKGRLDDDLQLWITQELVGCTKFRIDLPLGAGQWRWQVPLFHHVSNSIGPPAPAHPLDVLLEPDHRALISIFAFG